MADMSYRHALTYEERVAKKACFSFSFTAKDRETELKINNCTCYGLNSGENNAIFSLNEREDGKGMNVHIENVKVVPMSVVCIVNAPPFIAKILSKLFKTV